jgi:hypothetical protein
MNGAHIILFFLSYLLPVKFVASTEPARSHDEIGNMVICGTVYHLGEPECTATFYEILR